MIVRGWHVVVPATVLAWVLHGWGSGVVVYLLGWWAACVVLGGIRTGVLVDVRNPLGGVGAEPMPGVPTMPPIAKRSARWTSTGTSTR